MKVWLIGGTGDSRKVAQAIADYDLVISVTTSDAQFLYPDNCLVFVGKLDLEAIRTFCQKHEITVIVDASHPFAVDISRSAIRVSQELGIPYLRYERESVETQTNRPCLQLASFDELLQGDYLSNQRVLLTIGCKALPRFKYWQTRAVLYARVLPKLDSLQIALQSGFSSDRLIALRPPISPELETALLRQWQISLIVTKASGRSGGEDTKQKLAQELGIKLIKIARPRMNYPQQTSDLERVRDFLNLTAYS